MNRCLTANVAELEAIVHAMYLTLVHHKKLTELGKKRVVIYTDSIVAMKQF
jgi:ribonuclease HI